MASWILFDALLAAMLVLVVPFGFWRGGVKEAILSGSILAGAVLGNAFAVRWGSEVADLLGSRDAVGETVLAEALLWGSVAILGYVGGATVRLVGLSLVGRIAGSVLALFNGLLLLGYSLRFINILLLGHEPERWTEGGYIAGVLSRGTEEVLLLGTVVLGVGAVGGVIGRLSGTWSDEDELLVSEVQPASLPHAWPAAPPTPRTAVAGRPHEGEKIEPDVPSGASWSDLASPASWIRRRSPEESNYRGEATGSDPFGPIVTDGGQERTGRLSFPRREPTEPPPTVGDDDVPDGATVVNEWLRRAGRAADSPPPGDDDEAARRRDQDRG